MKSKLLIPVIVVSFVVVGTIAVKQSHPILQDRKLIEIRRKDESFIHMVAGAIRITQTNKEEVFLPGIRAPDVRVFDNWLEAAWLPVALLDDIDPKELILAVVMRTSINDGGWLVFESQRAVLLSHSEIAQLLVSRFGSSADMPKLIYNSSHD